MTIRNLRVSEDRLEVKWFSEGECVRKTYGGHVDVVLLADRERVLILEPFGEDPDNAVIFGGDGAQRVRIPNPFANRGALGFSEAGYDDGELTLIARLRGLEIACVLDESGNLLRTQELR